MDVNWNGEIIHCDIKNKKSFAEQKLIIKKGVASIINFNCPTRVCGLAGLSFWLEMIFHAPHLLLGLRWLVPAVCIFGSATNQCAAVALYRLLTLPFSPKFVWKFHNKLMAKYICLIGFFYENWSAVQVSIGCSEYSYTLGYQNIIFFVNSNGLYLSIYKYTSSGAGFHTDKPF